MGGTDWKEEAQLHDGNKIIVDRSVERGVGLSFWKRSPIKEQRLSFMLPHSNLTITWEDHYSAEVGSANLLPMALEFQQGTPYLITTPLGCAAYNKWGRPNPPYVTFKLQDRQWRRILQEEMPEEFKLPNLVIYSPDDAAKESTDGIVPAHKIRDLNASFGQSAYAALAREPLPKDLMRQMCTPMVYYKCGWTSTRPDGSFDRKYLDDTCK